MSFHLSDDGTLDTVVTCDRCGQDERYTYAGQDGSEPCEHGATDGCDACYDEWVEGVLEDAAETHDCLGIELTYGDGH
jgi:hypothetical protein